MDGRDYAKCQNQDKRTQVELIQLLMRKRQNCNSVIFSKRPKHEGIGSRLLDLEFRERKSGFSRGFRPIGPSVLDGARSKVALRR